MTQPRKCRTEALVVLRRLRGELDRLDEAPGENWPLGRVCIEALAACTLLLFLLDTAARFVGRLY